MPGMDLLPSSFGSPSGASPPRPPCCRSPAPAQPAAGPGRLEPGFGGGFGTTARWWKYVGNPRQTKWSQCKLGNPVVEPLFRVETNWEIPGKPYTSRLGSTYLRKNTRMSWLVSLLFFGRHFLRKSSQFALCLVIDTRKSREPYKRLRSSPTMSQPLTKVSNSCCAARLHRNACPKDLKANHDHLVGCHDPLNCMIIEVKSPNQVEYLP